jgi:hypothetical protein
MKTYFALAFLSVCAFGCSSESSDESGSSNENGLEDSTQNEAEDSAENELDDFCDVSGSVQATIYGKSPTVFDLPNTPLFVDPTRQFFEEELSATYIDVPGLGTVWSVSGSLRWTGDLILDSVIGLVSGLPHNALINYELKTVDTSGLVFLPAEPQDSQGTISATLTSEYRTGSSLQRTSYALGILPDYIQTSSQVIVEWRYIAATNEIQFGGVGYLDLGLTGQEEWVVNPVVSVCLGAEVFPF